MRDRAVALLVLICCVGGAPLQAQAVGGAPAAAPASDTAHNAHVPPFFTYRDALLLGGFIGGTIAIAPLDRHLAHTFQDPQLQENSTFRTAAGFFRFMGQPAPQIIGVGLYGVGRLTHVRRVEALGLHGLEAMMLATAVTDVGKMTLGRARPYVRGDTVPVDFGFMRGFKGRDFQAFPSGHATTAFAAASAVTAETSHWIDESHGWPGWKVVIGTTMYGGAMLIGVSRMYHNDHWASDVLAGAAIGTFSGIKTVRFVYRHPKNRIDRALLATRVVPAPDGGTYLAWSIPTGH
jgi:membrane-associated phospholipid phosphatase